ncbi:alpha/beta hydrolase [Cryomorpha ignava]|uniref:Alpha/beta hydrolase n=1 Tax=Cryomorpha ignava TaxID=101383 RepID=A0A7K3WV08_9FLAO|nr:alpha/beta hydrolase [Cryomorpha ignava]NEN24752.1 alpha/beta hydrolase [Cryomorpha ignava]
MKIILFALSLVSALTVFSQTSEEVIVVSDSIEIHGTLLCPEGTAKMPVVLIIAGSGPTDRDGNNPEYKNNSLKMLAESLADSGIASLRYDKRGVALSDDPNILESAIRFEDFSSDAAKWIQLLSEDKRFKNIVVLGHSEGSLIGMLASQTTAVDKYISVAGPGRPANFILLDQIIKSSPFFTVPATIMMDSLVNGYTVSSVLPALKEMFRPGVQPYLISWFKYDPAVEIAKLNKPVLIIQGSTDIQVPVSDAELLAEASPRAKLVIIEGMNHVFKEASAERGPNIKTYSNPDLALISGFAQEIIDFIRNSSKIYWLPTKVD